MNSNAKSAGSKPDAKTPDQLAKEIVAEGNKPRQAFRFDPQKDITTWELSQVLMLMSKLLPSDYQSMMKMDPGVLRHFRIVPVPVAPVQTIENKDGADQRAALIAKIRQNAVNRKQQPKEVVVQDGGKAQSEPKDQDGRRRISGEGERGT